MPLTSPSAVSDERAIRAGHPPSFGHLLSRPVLSCAASSLPSSSLADPSKAVAVLPSFPFPFPLPLPLPPSSFSLHRPASQQSPPLGAVGGCLSLLSIRPSTSIPPSIQLALSGRAWQCRQQQYSQYTVRSITLLNPLEISKESFAQSSTSCPSSASSQLTSPVCTTPIPQKKRLGWWRLVFPSLPAEDLLVQPLGCSRYLITPQLVGFVLLVFLSASPPLPAPVFGPSFPSDACTLHYV